MKETTYFSPVLSELKKYQPVWQQITSILKKHNKSFAIIPASKDIWVRDFMPVQRHDGKLIVYVYNPDYLQDKYSKYLTNCNEALESIVNENNVHFMDFIETDLLIDGGNVVKCIDRNGKPCVIMTTKVLYENPSITHADILLKLTKIFRADIILIPWDSEEPFGHSDGMVRSLSPGKLLLNNYCDSDPKFDKELKKALEHRFEIVQLSYGDKNREKSWCHINYLELSDLVLVPTASLASDKTALEQIETFTAKKCEPVSMSTIINEGGAMHCISWTMRYDFKPGETVELKEIPFNQPLSSDIDSVTKSLHAYLESKEKSFQSIYNPTTANKSGYATSTALVLASAGGENFSLSINVTADKPSFHIEAIPFMVFDISCVSDLKKLVNKWNSSGYFCTLSIVECMGVPEINKYELKLSHTAYCEREGLTIPVWENILATTTSDVMTLIDAAQDIMRYYNDDDDDYDDDDE